MADVSCQANVGKRRFPLLRAGSDLKKKNAAATFSHPYECEIVCAMADFPTPAGACSQKIRWGVLGLSIQVCICFNTLSRVPGWHWRSGSWADESWRASKETNSFKASNPISLITMPVCSLNHRSKTYHVPHRRDSSACLYLRTEDCHRCRSDGRLGMSMRPFAQPVAWM